MMGTLSQKNTVKHILVDTRFLAPFAWVAKRVLENRIEIENILNKIR